MTTTKKAPSLLDALIPLIALIIMLATSVAFYHSDSSYGANQIALILCAAIASLIGFKNGYSWKEMEKGIVRGISTSLGAILILLMVGALIGSWILAGTVPSMIYYGLQILSPSIFYAAACIICALVSLSIGSSWTTAGTVGVALIGIAAGLDMSMAITAGAIISGAYFGDKMSPLSDTTNLAPAVAGTDLFSHIRHMTWTTGPSILLAVMIFAVIGAMHDSTQSEVSLGNTVNLLQSEFHISLWAMTPLLLVLILAYKKAPAFLTLLAGSLLACLMAVFLQPEAIQRVTAATAYECVAEIPQGSAQCTYKGKELVDGRYLIKATYTDKAGTETSLRLDEKVLQEADYTYKLEDKSLAIRFKPRAALSRNLDAVWRSLFSGYVSNTGDAAVDDLLSRGGMGSMLNTIWLILSAMTFGAVLETIGLLQRLVESILRLAHSTGSLIVSVIATCIGTNIIAADQYIAIVLPGRMYRAEFRRRGLAPKNLSRVLEDSATITSPLIPWNTCGAYMAGALGVPTLVYLPYCFFNLINPLVSIVYGLANFKIVPLEADEKELEAESLA